MKTFVVGKNESGQRLDKYLAKLLRLAPKSFLYKMLRKKNITLNGKKAAGSEKLQEGDEIKLFLSEETFWKFYGGMDGEACARNVDLAANAEAAVSFSSRIIYEDEDFLFWNKPQGLLSQPDRSGQESVVELLRNYLLMEGRSEAEKPDTFRPAPVNRLDRNTSGIILCGKSLKGLQFLSDQVRSREVKKIYLCITDREPGEGTHTAWLKKDESRNQVTVTASRIPGSSMIMTGFKVIDRSGEYPVIEADLLTGRPHQIRAHLNFLGCHIIGDPKYGDPDVNREAGKKYGIQYQMLHAKSITFPQIGGGFAYLSGKTFEASSPGIFRRFLNE